MHGRRDFLKFAGGAALLAGAAPLCASVADAPASNAAVLAAPDLAALEVLSGGLLGVQLAHPVRGPVLSHRAGEQFPTASTIKFALCAAVLSGADAGALSLDDRIPVHARDVQAGGAPVSGRHVGKDITVRDLCRGSMVWSDNPAVSLLLPLVGGEDGLEAFLRTHGDADTQPHRIRDGDSTTTPQAMVHNLRRFVLQDTLSRASRLQLADWLIENRTGDTRIRAGVPEGWRVGDKTGGMAGVSNDIAVLWPLAGGQPWLLALYLRDSPLDAAARDAVLRRATMLAAAHLQG